MFAISPSLTCRPSRFLVRLLQRQLQQQQQHPSKRKDFDPRFVLLAFRRNFPDFVFRLRVENQRGRERREEERKIRLINRRFAFFRPSFELSSYLQIRVFFYFRRPTLLADPTEKVARSRFDRDADPFIVAQPLTLSILLAVPLRL